MNREDIREHIIENVYTYEDYLNDKDRLNGNIHKYEYLVECEIDDIEDD